MSSVDRAQALLLSHPDVMGAYVADAPTDQLLPRLPKIGIRGDSLQVTKVDTLATASFISSGGNADASATTYDTTAREFPLRRIAAKVEVTGDVAQNVSMINDVFEQQIQAKMLAIWETVGDKLIYGDGTDPNPYGLEQLATEHPAGVLDNAGALLALADLDELIYNVRPWDGGQPRAFVMNREQYWKVAGLAHTAGFDLRFAPDPILGRDVAHYMGVPILVSDHISEAETVGPDTTSVYLVFLGPRDGEPQLGGLVWAYNQDTGAGIRVDGPHRTSAVQDLLYADLELNIAFASLSTGSVLRMSNIQS
jgi:HK97 family phage major capsid protein